MIVVDQKNCSLLRGHGGGLPDAADRRETRKQAVSYHKRPERGEQEDGQEAQGHILILKS
jgi:hypothetical protein